MLRLACVLKSGGDFEPCHVEALQRQLAKHLPGFGLLCLTDTEVPCYSLPLEHNLAGWWSKMELFRPDIKGDLLFFDLDTVILKDIRHFAEVGRTVMLRDFRQTPLPASGLMYLTEEDRAVVWDNWSKQDVGLIQRRHRNSGDQGFLREHDVLFNAPRWYKLFPDQIISYKVHILEPGLSEPPESARVVCFHGHPRPWHRRAPEWARGYYDGKD